MLDGLVHFTSRVLLVFIFSALLRCSYLKSQNRLREVALENSFIRLIQIQL